MAFELSFAPPFFYAEGEPYDRSEPAVNKRGQPISLYSAVQMMDEDDWEDMIRQLFPYTDPAMVTFDMVVEKAEETDTCTSLRSPVPVWIDPDGDYVVHVYDDRD